MILPFDSLCRCGRPILFGESRFSIDNVEVCRTCRHKLLITDGSVAADAKPQIVSFQRFAKKLDTVSGRV